MINGQFLQALDDFRAVVAPRLANIGGPVLCGGPARIGGVATAVTSPFEKRGDIGIAAAANESSNGCWLEVHRVAGVLRRDDDIDFIGHLSARTGRIARETGYG
jgi:hypothetical protein